MQPQKLYSLTRKAVEEYKMIDSGDHIAVGVSGGKDSLCLLYALAGLRRFFPVPFTLSAITVSLGFPVNYDAVAELCEQWQVPYYELKTDIGPIVFQERQEKNPCSLCSKMRKGALNEKAKQLGCQKVALGHNKDDAVETFFLSLLYENRINTFSPVTYWDRIDLTAIRPLLFVSETETAEFAEHMHFPIVKNPCPVDGDTKRQEVKEHLAQWQTQYPQLQKGVFRALRCSAIAGWKSEAPHDKLP